MNLIPVHILAGILALFCALSSHAQSGKLIHSERSLYREVLVYEAGATPPWSFKGPYSANAARAAFVASVLGETRDIGP